MSSSKLCFKCKKEKPRSDFYKHFAMADGLLGKCKECTKLDVSLHRAKNIEKIREYDRARASLPHRAEQRKRLHKAWLAEDKRRLKCHNAVHRAVASGSLIPMPCEKCGSIKTVAHHDDYDKPLDVRWLCQACHVQHHVSERNSRADKK